MLYTHNLAKELYNKYNITQAEITLDGTADIHDNRRFTKNFKPSFNIILNNIKSICSDSSLNNLQINIRCNVDKSNYLDVINLIQYLKLHICKKELLFILHQYIHGEMMLI